MRLLLRLVVLLLAIVAVGAAGLWYLSSRGLSARAEPTRLEEALAVRLLAFATPAGAKTTKNPTPDDAGTRRAALEHFADHCAACHANDGSGQTDLGKGLYPKPPDLRAERTQSLSDGELFYIIQNGVRFTGMPAFADVHGAEDSWHLVRFIRHIPSLTPAELERIQKANPIKPEDEEAEHHQGR